MDLKRGLQTDDGYSSWTAWSLQTKALYSFSTSGIMHPVTQHHITEDLNPNVMYCMAATKDARFLLVYLTWQWLASLRRHSLFQLQNNVLERDFSGIKIRHKHDIFKSQDKTYINQSHYYCRLHNMSNTTYHYCQLWWPKSCRQKSFSFVAASYQSTHFKCKQDSHIYIYIYVCVCVCLAIQVSVNEESCTCRT